MVNLIANGLIYLTAEPFGQIGVPSLPVTICMRQLEIFEISCPAFGAGNLMVQCRFGKEETVPAELANLAVSLGQLLFDSSVDVRCGFRQALPAHGIPVLVFQQLLLAFFRALFVPAWRWEKGKVFPCGFCIERRLREWWSCVEELDCHQQMGVEIFIQIARIVPTRITDNPAFSDPIIEAMMRMAVDP